MPKLISVQVFLHEKLNNALEVASQKERLSKLNLIQMFVEDRLTQEGYLAKPEVGVVYLRSTPTFWFARQI